MVVRTELCGRFSNYAETKRVAVKLDRAVEVRDCEGDGAHTSISDLGRKCGRSY